MISRLIQILLFLFFGLTSTMGQPGNCPCNQQQQSKAYIPDLIGWEFIDEHPGKHIQFLENWAAADIFFVSGDSISGEYVRYNSLIDEMVWMRTDDYQMVILDRRFIKEIDFKKDNVLQRRFVKTAYENYNLPKKNAYMESLVNGKTNMLKHYRTVEISNTGELFRKVTYFLNVGDSFKNFNLKKASFLSVFGEDKKKVKQILRSNRLSVKNEFDLVKAVKIYNSQL